MKEDIIKMAIEEAEFVSHGKPLDDESEVFVCTDKDIVRLFHLAAAAEREKVAAWMMQRGFATGHGDTVDDLLNELEWQVAEREREACARVCESIARDIYGMTNLREYGECAAAIRARGQG